MMRIFILSVIAALVLPICGRAQQLHIGIWKDGRTTERFSYHSEYPVTWTLNNNRKITVPANKTSYLAIKDSRVKLSTAENNYGSFESIARDVDTSNYILKSLSPVRKEEIYSQGLRISSKPKGLHIINVIEDIDSYVAGVVEAESGKEQGLEYYKVQAIISRTYALSNHKKHWKEGYNLCDQVHCQVFHGISRFNPDIMTATRATEEQVLVDSDLNLITAAFHSNCGGHTVNSEDVWSKALPYLKAKKDTFCLASRHAEWQSIVLKSAWINFLAEQRSGQFSFTDKDLYEYQPKERSTLYPSSIDGFELKRLRRKWKLNSTLFSIEDKGETILLSGKGFGHGVGLCQEGAMKRADSGFAYQEVLEFYYTGVHLIHRSVMDFFKEN